MLLRMYLRWAEAHGYQSRNHRPEEGEEAGIKSVTIKIQGRLCLWLPAIGARRASSGAHQPVRLVQAPSHLVCAGRGDPDMQNAIDIVIDEKDLRSTPTDPAARAGSTSRRTKPPCACPHAKRAGRHLPERAQSGAEQRTRDERPEGAAVRYGAPQERGRTGNAEGRKCQRRTWAARFAPTCCIPTRWSRITAPTYETGNTGAVLDGRLDEFMDVVPAFPGRAEVPRKKAQARMSPFGGRSRAVGTVLRAGGRSIGYARRTAICRGVAAYRPHYR